MDKIRKLYLKHYRKLIKSKGVYYTQKYLISPYEKEVISWFMAQYKQFNTHHYFTEPVKILRSYAKEIVFLVKFTDTNLNGTVTFPLSKVMSLDVTFDDFVVDTFKSNTKTAKNI